MKSTVFTLAYVATCFLCLMAQSAFAGVVLQYDSAGNAQDLTVVGTTDASLVALADAMTSVDANGTIEAGLHNSQTQVQGPLGTGNDLHFRFGGNGTQINYALTPANVAGGYWIGTGFTAAQALTLDELSFHLFANSQNGSAYAARHVGLFASVDGGTTFTQFGALDETATGNGNQGIITFTDSLSVSSGQAVDLRLLFTDKTSTASNLQASTRVGNIQISATAAPVSVPEPSSAVVVLGIAGVSFLRRRRK